MATPDPKTTPTDKQARKLAQAESTMTWSLRSLKLGPVLLFSALVMALVDFGGRDKTILSAITLFVCFVAVFFGLAGLFGVALARETPGVREVPTWVTTAGVGTILGSFAVGLFGVLT